jgi:DNA-binding MarR family transcriptional regulator
MRIEEALKTTNFRDEQHKALLNLLYTTYWLKDRIHSTLKDFDLTNEQFNVLRILRGSLPKHMCVKDIGERLIEKSSNVPRILERLQRKGLIERISSDTDRRENVTVITSTALEMLDKLDVIIASEENEFMTISEEDAKLLNTILDQIRL